MKIIFAVGALIAWSVSAFGFEVDKDSTSTEIGAATVIEMNDETYALIDIPLRASMIKTSLEKPPEAEGTKVNPGCQITKDEALTVIEAYFRRYGIDFLSIKIRNTQLGDRQYIVWCDNPLFMLCSNWQIRAGTWFEYEINGKNRYGGMTGYQREIKAIRKNPKAGICKDQ